MGRPLRCMVAARRILGSKRASAAAALFVSFGPLIADVLRAPWLIFVRCAAAAAEAASEDGGFSVGLPEGAEREGFGAGSERMADVAGTSSAAGAASVGQLCTKDFKVSPRVASVCAEVGGFAAPAGLAQLFERMPVDRMFRVIEANAMRVSVEDCFCGRVVFMVVPLILFARCFRP